MQEEARFCLWAMKITPINLEILDKLTYIEAVAHETLRLKGAAPLICVEWKY